MLEVSSSSIRDSLEQVVALVNAGKLESGL